MGLFQCISVSPLGGYPKLAIATMRAGGIGILDQAIVSQLSQFSELNCSEDALAAVSAVVALSNERRDSHRSRCGQTLGQCGLRLRADQVQSDSLYLQQLAKGPYWLIVTDWQAADITADLADSSVWLNRLPEGKGSAQVLLEVTQSEQLAALQKENAIAKIIADKRVVGLVAKGYESGGWVAEESAFILTQKLLKTNLPVYVQGGIGPNTAAACRAAGAAGVVLDDQLWLMPESPLPEQWQRQLQQVSGQEALALGDRLGAALRVFARPGFGAIAQLKQQLEQLEIEPADAAAWRKAAAVRVGWGDPQQFAWPMGQAVGLAAQYRRQYRTTGRFIQALMNHSQAQLKACQATPPLALDSPLAQSHGVPYPIVQGPMTRVSDTAEFADAVSQGGGLPMLALALMKKAQVTSLLRAAQTQLGDRPWGVGLLGFAPQQLREDQIEVIKAVRPRFAIIAGGRPDQAAQLEADDIFTYIHVPTPSLLKLFLEQGANHFIFEGSECGGHVGPLSSFMLWESMVQVLLEQVPASRSQQIHVLFAGGVHDRLSAAMISALAMPLVQRGVRIGVLMGTAYLFTREAVAHGAIQSGFQQQAMQCDRTISLETSPGHASRCAVTPFAEAFYRTRRQMLAAGHSADDIKNTLEDLTLGRLRVASKGTQRAADGTLQTVDASRQTADGMYMIGQVATLRQQVGTIADLHAEVSAGSREHLLSCHQATEAGTEADAADTPQPSDIAIVGIGTLLPNATDPEQLWDNILAQVSAIREIPPHRWDWQLYYSQDRQDQNKVYSKWGGFLDAVPFDPLRYGIPPNSLKSIEPAQLLALETVRLALADAGYDKTSEFDREHTSVILGASGGSADLGQQYATRSEINRMVEQPEAEVWSRLPEWTEESFPGILLNVSAGRVANRFDFGGANFTVDAACASSLAAVDAAVQALESGRCSMAIAGGVDTMQSVFSYFCFSKTQALSPKGVARSFDRDADGIVISEGVAAVVLKRLADAERDGDRIYGVIKAVASSSDGRGLGLTAPASSGQQRALRRAYGRAGFSAATLGLYEAHGTGTAAGDRAELTTISGLLEAVQAKPNSCAVGSVKTLIGHTKSTAGVTALIKAVLALYHRTLPPHANVENPLDDLARADSPTYLLKTAQPWLQPASHPRRAGVSAFGFGGTNFHAVLEEYASSAETAPLGASQWPCELLLFPGDTSQQLLKSVEPLVKALDAGAKPLLADLAYSLAQPLMASDLTVGLAIVVSGLDELQTALAAVQTWLAQPNDGAALQPLPPHIQVHPQIHLQIQQAVQGEASGTASEDAIAEIKLGKVAFLFPGQGAQYLEMAREPALYFPELRQAVQAASAQLEADFDKPLSQYIYPPAAFTESETAAAKAEITQTQIAQPAIGTVSAGYLQLAERLGLRADMTAGHSYGEYSALYAAGVLSRTDFLNLSLKRGLAMANALEKGDANGDAQGAMAAVLARRETILPHLAEESDVVLANHNAPQQSVISGPQPAVERVLTRLEAADISVQRLPVAGAFHSRLVAAAQAELADAIAQTSFASPRVPVYSNLTAAPYAPERIQSQLTEHLVSPVEFVSQIQSMYEAGARVFVELGPKRILTKLTDQILAEQPHLALSLDSIQGLSGLLQSLGRLAIAGVCIDWAGLYQGRSVKAIALTQLAAQTQSSTASTAASSTWWVDGGSARPQSQTVGHFGKQPPLTQITKAARVAQRSAAAASPHRHVTSMNQPTHSGQPILNHAVSNHAVPNHASNPFVNRAAASPSAASGRTANPHRSANAPMTAYPSPSEAALLSAYQTYQASMHHFLTLQEAVIGQFLQAMGQADGSSAITAAARMGSYSMPSAPSMPSPLSSSVPSSMPSMAAVPAPAAISTNGNSYGSHNGHSSYNGHHNGHDNGHGNNGYGNNGQNGYQSAGMVPASTATLPLPNLAESPSPTHIPQSAPSVAPASHPAPPAPDASLPDEATLTDKLVALVSDRTGYPPDMLDTSLDMEAELGIDSIKRVEIFGAFRKQLPPVLADTLQANIEQFTQVKTLAGLVSSLLEAAPETDAPPGKGDEDEPPSAEVSGLGKPKGAGEDLPCYVMQSRHESLPAPSEAVLAGLMLVVAPADSDLAHQVVAQLQQAGADPRMMAPALLSDPDQLAIALAHYRKQAGAVRAIVQLAGAVPTDFPVSLPAWREQTQTQSKGLFYLLQACHQDLQLQPEQAQSEQTQPGQVIAVSALGGQFGRNGSCGAGSPCAGSSSGLLKTMMIEWPQVRAAAIDLDTDQPALEVALQIRAELQAGCPDAEVGYFAGKRLVFEPVRLVRSPQSGKALTDRTSPDRTSIGAPSLDALPKGDWVMLAIGGARGITAEVLSELVVPGLTLVLVGRSPLPTDEPAETIALIDPSQLRHWLVQKARAAGEKVTPAQIEQQLRKIQRDRAIRTNLAALRRAGATVDYRALDVRNEVEMAGLIDSIYQQYGRLDGVLQGAGIIEDKRLIHKQPDSFERVFDTKADSTFLLARYLRPAGRPGNPLENGAGGLKLMLLFASVAGRTGNQGQADYAAANEVVNRLAWWMQQHWPNTRVLSVNWGPWAVTGMASDEINRQFAARGVIPIPPQAGRRYVIDELHRGDRATVEVITGLFNAPPAEAMSADVGSAPESSESKLSGLESSGLESSGLESSGPESSGPEAPEFEPSEFEPSEPLQIAPLIDRMPQLQPTGSVTLSHTFTLENSPYLQDHCLDGKPVMAAAAVQEWLAEFVQVAWPDWVLCEVRNLRVLGGIVLKTAAGVSTQIVAKASTHASSEALEVTAEIKAAAPTGQALSGRVLSGRALYRATMILRPQFEPAPVLSWPPLTDARAVDIKTAYAQYCFHGPLFQLITQVDGLSAQGIDAQAQASSPAAWLHRPAETRGWLFDPGLMDASLQMGLIFARTQDDISALPSHFGRVVRYRDISPSESLRVYLRIKTFTFDELTYDAFFVDSRGQIALLLSDIEASCSAALNRLKPSAL